jgi:hypothetical protein
LLGSPLVELPLGLTQPHLPTLRLSQSGRQLIAVPLVVELVFGGVGGDLLLHNRLGELLVVHRPVAVGVGGHLGAVDRDHPDARQPRVGA